MSTATNSVQVRVGREKQRYDNYFRLVAGCIPYRLQVEKNCKNGFCEYEVLMISTPNRHDLVFPKGGWEDDETVHEAACREAIEEAGVRGIIDEKELGIWEFRSKSSKQNSCRLEGSCRGNMFALKVTDQLESWPEQDTHHRRWVSVSEAYELSRYDWMREALSAFLLRLQSTKSTMALPKISEPPLSFCSVKPSENERMDNSAIALC